MQPERFGKFEVRRLLGRGGFAAVYLGQDPDLDRLVAIKVCDSTDAELRERFAREGRVVARLRHENIPTVYAFDVQDGIPYLVQEYVEGEDLADLIRREEEALPLERKIEILTEVARGLDYAHGQGIVHRDVKPGNLRIAEDGKVKIIDFGIAKQTAAESSLTLAGTALGTIGYLAPEQLQSKAKLDHRADIFSFGAVAYELFTFKKPFSGEFPEVLLRILQEDPVSIRRLWPECPDALARIVERCLRKNPEDRYDGFRSVIADLAAVPIPKAVPTAQTVPIHQTVPIPKTPVLQKAPKADIGWDDRITHAAPVGMPRQREPESSTPTSHAFRTAIRLDQPRGWKIVFAAAVVLALAVFAAYWWRSLPVAKSSEQAAAIQPKPTAPPPAAPSLQPAPSAPQPSPGNGTPAAPQPSAPGVPPGLPNLNRAPVSPRPADRPERLRLLIGLASEGNVDADRTEEALLDALSSSGAELALDSGPQPEEGAAQIVALGRRHGAHRVVLAHLSGGVRLEGAGKYLAHASLAVRIYDGLSGELLGSQTIEGSGQAEAQTDEEGIAKGGAAAGEQVGRRAADAIRKFLRPEPAPAEPAPAAPAPGASTPPAASSSKESRPSASQ